jgi:predicted MFS family arabinose efflux permease
MKSQADLGLSDTETSLLISVFVIMLMVMSPIFGTLADRGWSRKLLLIFGTLCWSLSASAGFFAPNYATLLVFFQYIIG